MDRASFSLNGCLQVRFQGGGGGKGWAAEGRGGPKRGLPPSSPPRVLTEWYFTALDYIFLSIYMVEAVLKIIALGLAYFLDPWNNLGG